MLLLIWQITVSGKLEDCATADTDYEVELREAIASVIPSFIQLFEDEDEGVRLKVVEVIGKLANYGER
jgi:hypothetical protein